MVLRNSQSRQKGQIALITLFLFGLAFSVSLFGFVSTRSTTLDDNAQTERALVLARDALLAYASGRASSNRLGELPCPDTNNNGTAENSCNSAASRVGRLPTATLGIQDLRDGSGEKLWYAVSSAFRRNSGVTPVNSNTLGEFSVTGIAPAANVIAIVFAPGDVVAGQTRSQANINNVTHYLDGENANGDAVFAALSTSATFNDRLISITPAMFFPQIEMRAAREARLMLNTYYSTHGFYPTAYAYGGSGGCASGTQGRIAADPSACGGGQKSWGSFVPNWFWPDAWDQVLFYAVAPACYDPSTPNCKGSGGLLTVNGTTNVRAVIISPGSALSNQSRPCASIADCLESPNATGFPVFTHATNVPTLNDRVVVVAP